MIRYRGGFNAIIESAVDQIRAQGQGDGYLLAGYSFGGIVASEVARRLMELGKHVQFVGLIDARLVASPRPREELLSKTMRRMKRVVHPQNVIRSLPRRLISALSSISANSSLLMIGRLAEQLPSKLKFRFKWELTANVRMKSLRRWKVGPQDALTVLFRADTEGRPLDYGWNALCRQLVIVDTSGHHLELFNPSNRDVLCAKFLSVLDSAVSAARPTDEAFEQRWAQRDIASRAS